jgi:hypothetical protein
MLEAQTKQSADKAMAAAAVVIAAARPVAVVGKMVEHQVEQLHRLGDFGFRHWLDHSRSGVRAEAYHRPAQSASPRAYGKTQNSGRPMAASMPMAQAAAQGDPHGFTVISRYKAPPGQA